PIIIVPLFAMSFVSQAGFDAIAVISDMVIVKLILLALIWGYLHHFCAGIRYLVLDLHIGLDKVSAQRSARVVLGVSLALTLVFGLKLFGAW
ncbi:MAG: succinate dehydrogenase, cytochrome b556 subunit, partial [Burkholderiaceae bacterium]|nr:succinate dehydrogenase, cytochrome b556 subunit [Burkholderiaceae bacterium]